MGTGFKHDALDWNDIAQKRAKGPCLWNYSLSPGSETHKMTAKSLIEKTSVLHFEKGELGKCVQYFVRVHIKHKISQTGNFAFLWNQSSDRREKTNQWYYKYSRFSKKNAELSTVYSLGLAIIRPWVFRSNYLRFQALLDTERLWGRIVCPFSSSRSF
jgi:hypothetical protein